MSDPTWVVKIPRESRLGRRRCSVQKSRPRAKRLSIGDMNNFIHRLRQNTEASEGNKERSIY
jgi:hypothetical protein